MLRSRSLLCAAAVFGLSLPAAAQVAPPKAKGQLTVEYLYESTGSDREEGGYDPIVWRAKRTATITADVHAIPANDIPVLHGGQQAALAQAQKKVDKAASIASRVAPSMEAAQAIGELCGDDEACFEREGMKLAQQMQGNGQTEELRGAASDMAKLGNAGGRYHYWGGNFGTGTYTIEETSDIQNADPLCLEKVGGKCTRQETRRGTGPLPAAVKGVKIPTDGPGQLTGVEYDSATNSLALRLPVPGLTPGTETITGNEPAGTYDTPIPKGPQQKLLEFPVAAPGDAKPLIVKVQGKNWRNQAGTQVINFKGKREDGGKLTIRWRFTAT